MGLATSYKVVTTCPGDREVTYVVDWGQVALETTSSSYASGEIARIYHSWDSVGSYRVKVMAFPEDEPEQVSDWSVESSLLRVLPARAGERPATPGRPVGPDGDSTFVGSSTFYKVVTTGPGNESLRYVMDWGDALVETTALAYPSGEIARISHVWDSAGTYRVKAMAFAAADTSKASDWSVESSPLRVLPEPQSGGRPATPGRPVGPDGDSTYVNLATSYKAVTTCPGNESLRYVMDWGDALVETTALAYPSGEIARISHVWDSAGTYRVKAKAFPKAAPDSASGWSLESSPLRVLPEPVQGDSPPRIPDAPAGPDSAVRGDTAFFVVSAVQAQGKRVRFVLDWGDGGTDTIPGSFFPGELAGAGHSWDSTGSYSVRAKAYCVDRPELVSGWSPTAAIRVVPRPAKDVVDLIPLENEIPGWRWSSATKVAETPEQLWDLINGEGQIYLEHGFVKCVFQNYKGNVSGAEVELQLRIFDQGNAGNTKRLYDTLGTGLEVPWVLNHPGEEARIDTSLLFAYKVDFWEQRFYTWITIQDKSDSALTVAKTFALNVSAAIKED